jgi:catechol-2,3-dioxygenase
MCVHDLEEAIAFYCDILGARRQSRINFQIEEVQRGLAIFQSVILEDYMFALSVAKDYMPMPPDEQLRGAHGFRHCFCVPRKKFDEVMRSLASHGILFEGPRDHPDHGPFGQSIYFKDPSANFLEILWRRDNDVDYNMKRRYIATE